MVVETGVARQVRKLTRDDGIFTYYHALTHNWVLAVWLHKRSRVCTEIDLWEGSPHECPRSVIESALRLYSANASQRAKEIREKMASQDRGCNAQRDDSAREREDLLRFLRKRSGTHREDDPSWNFL